MAGPRAIKQHRLMQVIRQLMPSMTEKRNEWSINAIDSPTNAIIQQRNARKLQTMNYSMALFC